MDSKHLNSSVNFKKSFTFLKCYVDVKKKMFRPQIFKW